MPTDRPLLMIPGPVEISPAVLAAASGPPPGHTSPRLMEAFGSSLEARIEAHARSAATLRSAWRALGLRSVPREAMTGNTLSFRIGHMGYTATRPDWLRRTVEAVGGALRESGTDSDLDAALAAFPSEG